MRIVTPVGRSSGLICYSGESTSGDGVCRERPRYTEMCCTMTPTNAEQIPALPAYLRKRGLIRATIFTPASSWKMILLAAAFLWLNHAYLGKLVKVWWTEPDWSHGFIIPLFCLYFLASNYQKLLKVAVKPAYSGLVLVLLGLVMQTLAFWLRVDYGVSLGMIALLFGMVLWLGGWGVIKIAWLPILFLLFAVNIPEMIYRDVAYQLQQFAAQASVLVLRFLSVEANMAGETGQAETVITLWSRGGDIHQLNVEEACSGMRLLMAFGALAVAVSYLSDRPAWERLVLIGSALPVAILCNLLRVVITGVLYYQEYPEYAQGIFHTFTGLLMLVPAGLMYLGLAKLMDMLMIEDYSHAHAEEQTSTAHVKTPEPEPEQEPSDSQTAEPSTPKALEEQEQKNTCPNGKCSTWRQIIQDKHFLACFLIVLVAAGSLEASINILKIKLLKRPAELRAKLTSMPIKLGSFDALKFKNSDTGEMEIDRVLPEDFIHALGTDLCLQRTYKNSDPAEGEADIVSVFSTYYTGKPELVPHVPERCQAAAGSMQTGSETFDVTIPSLGLPDDKLTVRATTFSGTDSRTGQTKTFAIIYFFVANGEYFDDWKRVRLHLKLPQAYFWDKYSYYAFFRLTFPTSNDKAECISTAKRFLKEALPEMVKIWPDWEELSKRE